MQDIIFIFIPLNIALITFIFLALIERSAVEILLMFRLTFGNILERKEWSSLEHFPYFRLKVAAIKAFKQDVLTSEVRQRVTVNWEGLTSSRRY